MIRYQISDDRYKTSDMRHVKSFINFVLYIFILGSLFFFVHDVHADETKGLHVSPTRIIDSANSSEIKTIKFTLIHKGDRATNYDIKFKSFELINNNFEIKFHDTLDPVVEGWILNKERNILLEQDKPTEFELKLNISNNIVAQGYSFAIFFESQSIADDKLTVIKQSIAIPVLLNVSSTVLGESTNEGLIVKKFETSKIQFTNNANFDILIENGTKFFAVPVGSLEVESVWGMGEYIKSDFNNERKVISANTGRNFAQTLNLSSNSIGKLKAKLYFVYGDTNRVGVAEYEFFVVPWWFIIVAALVIILIIIKVFRRNSAK